MLRGRLRALRLLLVCAVLAFTSAPPRVILGWFESVTQIAGARSVGTVSPIGERASDTAPNAPSKGGEEASSKGRRTGSPEGSRVRTSDLAGRESRWRSQITLAFEAASRAPSRSPNTQSYPPLARLYLKNSALLC